MLGSEARVDDVARLLRVSADRVVTLASELVSSDLLVEVADEHGVTRLTFRHPLVQSAVYAELSLGERARLHRAAARRLRERGADPGDIAAHVLAVGAPGDDEMFDTLRHAALRALAAGAPDSAARYLRHILEGQNSEPDPTVSLLLGLAEARLGLPSAITHLEATISTHDDARARARRR